MWKYPELDRYEKLYPHPSIVFRQSVWWTRKYDGSCVCVWKDPDTGEVHISSRNVVDAADDLRNALKSSREYPRLLEILDDNPNYFLFGELLLKGKSPARFEDHKRIRFMGFDIKSADAVDPIDNPDGWITIPFTYQIYYQYKIPTPPVWATSDFEEIQCFEDLEKFDLHMKRLAKKRRCEGVVAKTTNGIFRWKIKVDRPTPLEKLKREGDVPELPPLPDSEAFGAVDKVFGEIGFPDFENPSRAMPKIAENIEKEKLKHLYGNPRMNYFYYYQSYLKSKKESESLNIS